jgi:hypothetical protein
MKIVSRNSVKEPLYKRILATEVNHNHPLVQDVNGAIRWKEDPDVRAIMEKIGLNDIVRLFHSLGYDKNSEPYRKLYRDIGYSLSGYWEIFYWEANNDEADKYKPSVSIPIKDLAKKLIHKKV